MKYIMVSDFEGHWDKIEKNFTAFSKNLLKSGMNKTKLIPGTETLFIKKMKNSGKIEKSWKGKVLNIENLPGKIFFQVEIEKEIICPTVYSSLDCGWYCINKLEEVE